MVSLKDIAAKAGVSVATVSKALRDQNDIGEETKNRIKTIASELGYISNAAARALKTRQSNNIGVLYMEETGYGLKHEYFAGVLQGFKQQAEQLGYDLTFINTNDENGRMSYIEHCRYRNFDGVVIVCALFDDARVIELMNSDLPTVTIDYTHEGCSSVSSDNTSGIASLVEYAYKNGHRKIAYIHGQKHSFVTKERVSSFLNKMVELGLSVDPAYITEAAYRKSDEAAARTRELMALEDKPTCILYPDDASLVGGLNVLYDMGLRVPEDIAVAGYDGGVLSELLMPKPTTVKQDTNMIGQEAAKKLVALIQSDDESTIEHAVVGTTLVEGESI